MYSCRAGRDGDVGAIVDQDWYSNRGDKLARQSNEVSRAYILEPELHASRAPLDGSDRALDQSVLAIAHIVRDRHEAEDGAIDRH